MDPPLPLASPLSPPSPHPHTLFRTSAPHTPKPILHERSVSPPGNRFSSWSQFGNNLPSVKELAREKIILDSCYLLECFNTQPSSSSTSSRSSHKHLSRQDKSIKYSSFACLFYFGVLLLCCFYSGEGGPLNLFFFFFLCYCTVHTAFFVVYTVAVWTRFRFANAYRSKIRLMRSLAMSIFLYACETWTITADIERRIQALEMRCFRKLLGISYRDHITNEEVKARIGNAIGPYEDLLTTVKRRKLKWYGHVTRSSGLAKTILQGTVQGGRRRGRQRKRWEDNIKEWTGLQWNIALRKAENREEWRKLVVKSTVVPQRSARLRDR